ncbi:unnamed protein product [Zymoseptoria tritici ST99CH_3D7]|uniref:Uncharacterized protein n=1 Tax=Zymoseptoria tritici (strain ST99CH_3D7) TaxID=1276538 RepID=A0A1X7RV87_ZYMT9|nr:unnamed protein product [Zymoseptoria tritici ST99CH_3D7]
MPGRRPPLSVSVDCGASLPAVLVAAEPPVNGPRMSGRSPPPVDCVLPAHHHHRRRPSCFAEPHTLVPEWEKKCRSKSG